MENKKKLNLIFSLIIVLSTIVCLCSVISLAPIRIFESYWSGAKQMWVMDVRWTCAAPILAFGGIATLLSIVKIFKCSISTMKSSNRTIGTIALIADILLIIGFVLVVCSLVIFDKQFNDPQVSEDIIEKLGDTSQALIFVGAPTMFAASIASFGLNHKASK